MVVPTRPNSITGQSARMNRASEVPPDVDRSGRIPSLAWTVSATTCTKRSGGVSKASPEIAVFRRTLPGKAWSAVSHSAASHRTSPWPVWAGLKRMLSRALALAGMTLVATSSAVRAVNSRCEGWNSG